MKDNVSTTIEHDEVILIGSMHNNSTVDQAAGIELAQRIFLREREMRDSSAPTSETSQTQRDNDRMQCLPN